MDRLKLYRKRLIPQECNLLKDDKILYQDEKVIITKWKTLRPKKVLHHGFSCYFLEEGYKVSKFFDRNNNLICWYCDIIKYEFNPDDNSFIFTDLLADVIVYPDSSIKVDDLDELADALELGLIDNEDLKLALRTADKLLKLIYMGRFSSLQNYIETYEYNER